MSTDDRPADERQCVQTENTVYDGSFDPQHDSVSEAVLVAVGSLIETDPVDLPHLSEYIDPEALDALFGPRLSGPPRRSDGRIVFTYLEFVVCVCSRGSLVINDPER
jgi:hypothetical protein